MPEPSPGAAAGARIRALRLDRGLSLSALASAAGIGKGSLSELESGRRNPTLDTLYAVAGPLGVPLVALLGEAAGHVTDGALDALLLSVDRTAERVEEVYLLTLPPGAARRSPAHAAGVTEQLVVLEGTARVEVGGGRTRTAYDVAPGEMLTWDADVPHGYACTSDGPWRALDVIRTPVS